MIREYIYFVDDNPNGTSGMTEEEVVRCKDCKHHDDFFVGAEDSLLCWKGGTDRVVSAMGYCECGERSEE